MQKSPSRKLAFASLFLLVTPTVRSAEPAPDPFLGRWMLDPKASTYPANTCPRKMIIEMDPDPRGIHYHSETVPAVGEPFQVDYSAGYDGRPAVVTGDRGILLPVRLRRESTNHVIAAYLNGGQVTATSDRTISANGEVMTIVTTSHTPEGKEQTNIGVYHRIGRLVSK